MKRLHMSLIGFFLSTTVFAAGPDKKPYLLTQIGTGTLSCGMFIKHKEENNVKQMDWYLQWAWGFMSAYNLRGYFGPEFKRPSSGEVSNLPDEPTVFLFLEKHCRDHPLDSVYDATIGLIRGLGGQIAGGSRK